MQESETEVFGHIKRRDQEYVGRKTLETVSPGIRRLKPKRRWMDCVNLDTRAIGTTKVEVHDKNWLEENCVCRSNATIKWKRLEREED